MSASRGSAHSAGHQSEKRSKLRAHACIRILHGIPYMHNTFSQQRADLKEKRTSNPRRHLGSKYPNMFRTQSQNNIALLSVWAQVSIVATFVALSRFATMAGEFQAILLDRPVITGGRLGNAAWLPEFAEKHGKRFFAPGTKDYYWARFCGLPKKQPWAGICFPRRAARLA